MNKLIVGCLLAGVCAAPAMAASFTGFGELGAGIGYMTAGYNSAYWYDGTLDSTSTYHSQDTVTILSGAARGNIAFSGGLGLQLDAEGQSTGYGRYSYSTSGIGAHLYQRSDDWLYGGLLSIGQSSGDRAVTVGLEAQYLLPDTTIYGQISYSAFVQGYMNEDGQDSVNAFISVRHFVTDHIMLSGTVSGYAGSQKYESSSYVDKESFNALQWEVKGEYLFEDVPLSLYASYVGSYGVLRESEDDSPYAYAWHTVANQNVIMIGIRYYFGQDTLLTNDRTGATLEDRNAWYGAINPFTYYGGPA
jgi:hypothetical protein